MERFKTFINIQQEVFELPINTIIKGVNDNIIFRLHEAKVNNLPTKVWLNEQHELIQHIDPNKVFEIVTTQGEENEYL